MPYAFPVASSTVLLTLLPKPGIGKPVIPSSGIVCEFNDLLNASFAYSIDPGSIIFSLNSFLSFYDLLIQR